jgi:hypothetical protein
MMFEERQPVEKEREKERDNIHVSAK